MAKLTINVGADIRPAINVNRFSQNNKPTLLRTAANRYLKYLKDRFISNSRGGGDWKPLDPDTTVPRKTRRGVADDPNAILIEYGALLANIRLRVSGGRIYAGYGRDTVHPSSNEKNKTRPGPGRGHITIVRLVRLHQGAGRNPTRIIIVLPNETTRKQMIQDIRNEYKKVVRK